VAGFGSQNLIKQVDLEPPAQIKNRLNLHLAGYLLTIPCEFVILPNQFIIRKKIAGDEK